MSMIADKIGIKKPSLYKHFSSKEDIKVIYFERSIQPMAARIVAEEVERMIIATKQLFYAMEVHKLLHFENADMSALSFAMTIHGLMDYELDQKYGYDKEEHTENNLINDYLSWFCKENSVEDGD